MTSKPTKIRHFRPILAVGNSSYFCSGEKAKQSQKHNEHVHFLGSRGYRAKRTMWCIEDPIAYLETLESLDSSILSSDRSNWSYEWVRARTKKEDDIYYIPNSQDKGSLFDKMVNYLILHCIKS